MAKIKFSNGQTVNFDGNPTEADVEEVAKSLGLSSSVSISPAEKTTASEQQTAQQLNPVQNTGVGIVKGALSTLKGLGTIGMKIGSAIELPQLKGQEIYDPNSQQGQKADAFLEPASTGQAVGNTLEKVAEFAIPGSKVAGATEKLSFLPRVALRTAADAGITGVQTGGDIGEMEKTGAVSAGIQTAVPVIGYGMKILGSLLKGSAGTLSRNGTDVIEEILKNPKGAMAGLKGDPLTTLKSDVGNIRGQIAGLSKSSTENYGQALADLPVGVSERVPSGIGPTGMKDSGATIIKSAIGDVKLTMQGVKTQLTSLLKSHGAEINRGNIDLLGTKLSKSEGNILKQVWSDVYRWKDTSPKGLDTLAAKINGYKVAGQTSPELNGILANLSKGTRNYLAARVPEARPIVQRYIQEQNFLTELQTYLGKVGNAKDAAGVKVTTAKLQTLFTKNKELAREVLTKLPGGEDILARQAGRELSTQVARSTSAIGSVVENIVNTVIPPKIIGQITAITGMGLQEATTLVSSLQKVAPELRKEILLPLLRASALGNSSTPQQSSQVLSPQPQSPVSQIGISSPNTTTFSPEVKRLLNMQ